MAHVVVGHRKPRFGHRPKTTIVAFVLLALAGTFGTGRAAIAASRALDGGLNLPTAVVPVWVQILLTSLFVGGVLAYTTLPWTRLHPGWGLAAASLVSVGVVCVGTVGREARVEFSPERFEWRRVEWQSLPLPHMRVTPEKIVEAPASPLGDYLRAKGYLSATSVDDATWDFCWGRQFHYRGLRGRARSFQQVVSYTPQRWINWSEANPDRAKTLWPRVIAFAQKRQYLDAWSALSKAQLSSGW